LIRGSNVILLAAVAGLLSADIASAADLDVRTRGVRARRVAALEQVVYTPGECRVGWWQTLRAGHVRPLWGVRCR
jgi:hypothetical protein